MKPKMPLAALALAVVLAAPAAAQRIWIVDSSGGPGVDFTDLPPAVQAANVGDTILVRPGTGAGYTSPTITKGLRVVGDAPGPIPLEGIGLIENLPVGQVCTVSNFSLQTARVKTNLGCRNNRGTVILERIVHWFDGTIPFGVLDCDLIVVDRCSMWNGRLSIRFFRSRVYLIQSEFRGVQGVYPLQAAVEVEEGQLTIVDSYIRGADGREAFCGGPITRPTAAVLNKLSVVFVQGRTRLEGGVLNGQCISRQAGAVVHFDIRSTTFVDPLVSHRGGFDQYGTIWREMAAVSPGPITPGRVQPITSYGPAGSTSSLFASLPTGRPPIVLPIGDLFLDPFSWLHVASAPLDANREHTVSVTLPASLPQGLTLLWQSAMLTPGGTFELSSPATTVVW